MAKKILLVTGIIWGILFLIGFASGKFALGFFPLCGLYPGGIASGDRGYDPRLIALWSVLAGLVFAALGVLALRRQSVGAAVAFLCLFLFSGFIFIARAMQALSDLH